MYRMLESHKEKNQVTTDVEVYRTRKNKPLGHL